MALNLEKLGDYAVNIAEQAVHVSRLRPAPCPFDLAGAARVALAALDEVITSFTDADADKAKHACRCELELDRRYRDALARGVPPARRSPVRIRRSSSPICSCEVP